MLVGPPVLERIQPSQQALTVAWAGLGAHAWQFLLAGLVFGLGGELAIVPIFSIKRPRLDQVQVK